MKELILLACVVVLILYYVYSSQKTKEGFFVCAGCTGADEISYTALRNPYYWPFSGTNNISGVVNTMYTGKDITELGGEEVTKNLIGRSRSMPESNGSMNAADNFDGLPSCGIRGVTHDGMIQLAHHSEPDHVPLTE